MSFAIGETVGAYRIVAQLGQGGMATVYKAYHAALDRYVAIKVLHPAFLEDDNFLARFQREARLVARLEHPNIVPVYDFADHNGQPYLVMKYIEGETLKAHMSRGPLASDEVLHIVESIGAGLAYAHQQGILHRDIKPSNVILANDGSIYLADFGLARIAQGGGATLTSDMLIGTPQYIAPEQAVGKKDLDERTDIYSLGVMLYEIAVGRVPYTADTPFAIIHDHIYSPLPLPRELNPNVPESVERVLLKALAKDREDRYASVDALVTAFKTAWQDSGIPDQDVTLALPKEAETAQLDGVTAAAQPAVAATVQAEAADSSAPRREPPHPDTPEEQASPPDKKKKRWGCLLKAFLIFIVLAFILAAINHKKQPAPTPGRLPPSAQPADDVSVPGIVEARRIASQNPDDPFAHHKLGMAYFYAEHYQQAMEEFLRVTKLTGNDLDATTAIAEEAYAQGIMPEAALLYGKLAYAQKPHIDPEVHDRLAEALFETTAYPEGIPEALPIDMIDDIDPALRWMFDAQMAYYNGDVETAAHLLEKLYNDPQGDPILGQLLEADFAMVDSRWDDARAIIADMQSQPLPEWVAYEIEWMQDEIP